jgi:MFS family permease
VPPRQVPPAGRILSIVRRYLTSLDPHLPRDVYVLQAGALVNAFGNGVVLPFLIIYLHNVRGISLGVAGLAAAMQSAVALLSGLVAGTLSDRLGAKRVMISSLVVMTAAFALMPQIHEPWEAFAIYAVWGAGSGAFWPSQSSLLAGLAPPTARSTAFALQRLAMNLGVAFGGIVAGTIASVADPGTFTVLFAVNCATFVGYIAVLTRVPNPELHPEHARGTWRAVSRDRTFLLYTSLNAVFMAAAMSLMIELLPAYAKNVAHVDEREVGVIFALNSLTIVLFQLPLAKAVQGRRRMRGLAVMGVLWAGSLLTVGAAGEWTTGTAAAVVLGGAAFVFALGECLHGAIHAPLGVDLAPPQLVGRYMALSSLSWQVGWIVGPACGGFFLQHAPVLLWPVAAAVNLVGSLGALALEHRLPPNVRVTPYGRFEPELTAG